MKPQRVTQSRSMDSLCPFMRKFATGGSGFSHESFIQEILSHNYQVAYCTWDAGDLVIFAVTVLDAHPEYEHLHDRPLEAQAFREHCELPPKLYESRKRRIRRLRKSQNLVDDFKQGGLRVVVCRSPEEGIGRHCKQQGGKVLKHTTLTTTTTTTTPSLRFQEDDFPVLGRNGTKRSTADTLDPGGAAPTYARVTESPCHLMHRVPPDSSLPAPSKVTRAFTWRREAKEKKTS